MPMIYAAPFIMLSLLSFATCLAIPSLRRISLPALVAPVSFGFFSITGWISFVLLSRFVLKLSLGPASGIHGIIEGTLFYLVPGILGSWAAVAITRTLERRLLKTRSARDTVLNSLVSLVIGAVGGLLGLRYFGSNTSIVVSFSIAAACALISVVATFLGIKILLRRRSRNDETSSILPT